LQQLLLALVQELVDGLLDARVVQFALAGGLAGDEFVDGVTDSLARSAPFS